MANQPRTPDIEGEGNYTAAREFRKAEEDFVRRGPVEKKAREAERALDGPEGKALEKARRESAAGDPRGTGKTPKSSEAYDWKDDPRR